MTNRSATLIANITWQHRDETEEIKGPFDMSIRVGSVFLWRSPEASDDDILGWIEFNAQHLLWPYLRSYVSMISGASGAPPLTIYTISAPRPTLGENPAGEDAPASDLSG